MEHEYIERGTAIAKLTALEVTDSKATLRDAKRLLADMPTADVAPVVHGRWISLTGCENEGVYCSICKKKVWKSDYAWCSKKSRNKLRSNYCPWCGARMDGGDD